MKICTTATAVSMPFFRLINVTVHFLSRYMSVLPGNAIIIKKLPDDLWPGQILTERTAGVRTGPYLLHDVSSNK